MYTQEILIIFGTVEWGAIECLRNLLLGEVYGVRILSDWYVKMWQDIDWSKKMNIWWLPCQFSVKENQSKFSPCFNRFFAMFCFIYRPLNPPKPNKFFKITPPHGTIKSLTKLFIKNFILSFLSDNVQRKSNKEIWSLQCNPSFIVLCPEIHQVNWKPRTSTIIFDWCIHFIAFLHLSVGVFLQ